MKFPWVRSLLQRWTFILFKILKQRILHTSDPMLRRYEGFFAFFFCYGLRVCRREILINLAIAYPALSLKERKQLAQKNYFWFIRSLIFLLGMDRWKGKTQEVAFFENSEILETAISEEKGVLLLGGHFGCWEIVGPALSEQGYDVSLYTGAQSNPDIDAFQDQIRANLGVQIITKGPAARISFLKALRGQKILAMLIDQNDRKSDVFVDFFGLPASMSKGAAAFHLLRKSPIVLFFPIWEGNKVKIIFERIPSWTTDTSPQTITQISQRITLALEQQINHYPEQYFWMHRRWKTRPPQETRSIY